MNACGIDLAVAGQSLIATPTNGGHFGQGRVMNVTAFRQLSAIVLATVFSGPNYSFNATVTCRGDNLAPGAAR
jgi:hypothetical protein